MALSNEAQPEDETAIALTVLKGDGHAERTSRPSIDLVRDAQVIERENDAVSRIGRPRSHFGLRDSSPGNERAPLPSPATEARESAPTKVEITPVVAPATVGGTLLGFAPPELLAQLHAAAEKHAAELAAGREDADGFDQDERPSGEEPIDAGARERREAARDPEEHPTDTVIVDPGPTEPINKSRAKLEPGDVFANDFSVVRTIAQGGMSTVYEVEQLSTGRHRALKVMQRSASLGENATRRFMQEARVTSKVESDHVVDVLGAGADDDSGLFWIAMELLQGETLGERLQRLGHNTPMPADEAWALLAQLCRGLVRAHAEGVVHRDLKPANVFLAQQDGAGFTVKILDFGIAHLLDMHRSSERVTCGIGTPLWMAPEQASDSVITPAADVWAVGLIAFRVLSGRMYWVAATGADVNLGDLLGEMGAEPKVPASVRAEDLGCAGRLPMGFDAWFSRCVTRNPAERFADAEEMAAALAEIAPAANTMPVLEYVSPTRSTPPPAAVTTGSMRAASIRPASGPNPSVRPPLSEALVDESEVPTGARTPKLTPKSGLQRAAGSEAPWPQRPSASDEAPTMRVRAVQQSEEMFVPIMPKPGGIAGELPSGLPPPRAPERPMPAKGRQWLTVGAAFAMGAACVFAVHLAAGPGGITGIFRQRRSVGPASTVTAPDAATEQRVENTPVEAQSVLPMGVPRTWTGTMTGDGAQLSFVLALRVNDSGRAAGHFAWTIEQMPGARAGEQVRETLEGTYDATMGVFELHGVRSTNPAVLAVNAYRITAQQDGTVTGETSDGLARLTGALPPSAGAAPLR